jgi:hypothetical protein
MQQMTHLMDDAPKTTKRDARNAWFTKNAKVLNTVFVDDIYMFSDDCYNCVWQCVTTRLCLTMFTTCVWRSSPCGLTMSSYLFNDVYKCGWRCSWIVFDDLSPRVLTCVRKFFVYCDHSCSYVFGIFWQITMLTIFVRIYSTPDAPKGNDEFDAWCTKSKQTDGFDGWSTNKTQKTDWYIIAAEHLGGTVLPGCRTLTQIWSGGRSKTTYNQTCKTWSKYTEKLDLTSSNKW